MLPADDASYGFDNIAGVLKMSPTLMEQYLAAAQRVSRLAVGTPARRRRSSTSASPTICPQDVHLPGLPFGTRGGTQVDYVFPADAEYEIRVRIARDLNESVPAYTEDQQVEINIDGARVGGFTLPGVGARRPPRRGACPGPGGLRRPGQACAAAGRGAQPAAGRAGGDGQQPERPQISQIDGGIRVTRAPARGAEQSRRELEPARARQGRPARVDRHVHQSNVGARRDHAAAVPASVPCRASTFRRRGRACTCAASRSRGRITSADPATRRAASASSRAVPRQPSKGAPYETSRSTTVRSAFSRRLARRAYRRPVTDADVAPLLVFYREAAVQGFDEGIQRAVRRLLVSPEFLLRVERDPANAAPGSPYRISDIELASRLSFFLWSSIPDDELLTAGRTRPAA